MPVTPYSYVPHVAGYPQSTPCFGAFRKSSMMSGAAPQTPQPCIRADPKIGCFGRLPGGHFFVHTHA